MDIRKHVARLYEMASCDETAPPGVGRVAMVMFGADALCWAEDDQLEPARLVRHENRWRIAVRRDSRREQRVIWTALMLAGWYCGVHDLHWPVERMREFATAIALPYPWLSALRRQGYSADQIAKVAGVEVASVETRLAHACGPDESGVFSALRITA